MQHLPRHICPKRWTEKALRSSKVFVLGLKMYDRSGQSAHIICSLDFRALIATSAVTTQRPGLSQHSCDPLLLIKQHLCVLAADPAGSAQVTWLGLIRTRFPDPSPSPCCQLQTRPIHCLMDLDVGNPNSTALGGNQGVSRTILPLEVLGEESIFLLFPASRTLFLVLLDGWPILHLQGQQRAREESCCRCPLTFFRALWSNLPLPAPHKETRGCI